MGKPETLHCEICGSPLAPAGRGCVACLLQAGLGEERASRRYQHFEILTRADGSLWELGRGAMGVTYKARDIHLEMPVALKIIGTRFSADPHARQRLLREARAAARLRHPQVASVLYFGMPTPEGEESEWFYAMEFIEGENLEQYLRRCGPLEVEAVLKIALQITRALAAAEQHGIVHRDLKPANIMLVDEQAGHGADGDAPCVKVIDFGLAQFVDAAERARGEDTSGAPSFSGTPEFASPEQLAGRAVDRRTDIYSLGVSLCYLLTGELPPAAPTSVAGKAGVSSRNEMPSLPGPKKVSRVLGWMLAASPEERPANAEALRAALLECLAECGPAKSPSKSGDAPALLTPRVHELYRLARNALGSSTPSASRFADAIRHLEAALEIEPRFARAHALLAEVHALMFRKSFDRSPARAAQVLEAAEAAWRVQPGGGEAHRARGIHEYYIRRDYERAAEEFRLSLQSSLGDAETLFCLGLTERRLNRWAAAVPHFQEAMRLDPYHPDYGTHCWKTLSGLHRYGEAREVLDGLIASNPEHLHLRVHRAYLSYSETGDLQPLHTVLAGLPPDYDPNGSITFLRVGMARYECDADAADRYLAASSLPVFQGHIDGQLYPREILHLLNVMLRNDPAPVRALIEGILPGALAWAEAAPEEPGPLMVTAQMCAISGQTEEALERGWRAFRMLPPESDGVDGPTLAIQLAWAYLHLKDPGTAMDLLAKYAWWPGGISYGDLLLGNTYDGLRGDPRYPALLAALSRVG